MRAIAVVLWVTWIGGALLVGLLVFALTRLLRKMRRRRRQRVAQTM